MPKPVSSRRLTPSAAPTVATTASGLGGECPALAGPYTVDPAEVAGVENLIAFILERHAVYTRKTAGEPRPWSSHPAFGPHLQRYRFCNVYREFDTVTRWIADRWRTPHHDDPDLFFAMAVARFVNWPDTLAEVGFPIPWDPEHFVAVLESRQARGEKVFTGAYVIHADRHFPGSKAAYLAAKVLTPLWDARAALRQITNGTLAEAHRLLTRFHGVGSFMAGQVIADLKYAGPLRSAPDWHTWAAPGPGSERGLNRVQGRPENAPWPGTTWLRELQALHREIAPMIAAAGVPPLHAQDIQNCLCEWSKMVRLLLGEGKPRSSYPGRRDDR